MFTALAHDVAVLEKYTAEHATDETTVAKDDAAETDKETKQFLEEFDALKQEIAELKNLIK